MRIFIAIKISEELQQQIGEWVHNFQFPRLRQGFGGQAISNFQCRWTAPKNLHVTLVPPWESEQWTVLSEQLQEVISKPFEIKFDRVSLGPDSKQPRLIWAGGPVVPQLQGLRLKIYDALGQPVETRPFRPHITLARFRREDAHKLPESSLDMPVDWRQTVTSFVLMQSHLSSQGSDYEVLEEFKL